MVPRVTGAQECANWTANGPDLLSGDRLRSRGKLGECFPGGSAVGHAGP